MASSTAAEKDTKVDVSDIPTNRPESQELATVIASATKALEEKSEALAKVQSARTLCTLMVENGIGNREQVTWIRTYLPRKKRRTNGEDDE